MCDIGNHYSTKAEGPAACATGPHYLYGHRLSSLHRGVILPAIITFFKYSGEREGLAPRMARRGAAGLIGPDFRRL
jgi:hypothetical protein